MSVYSYFYHTYSQTCLKFDTSDVNIILLIICEIRGRCFTESHNFLTGVNSDTCKIVPCRDVLF